MTKSLYILIGLGLSATKMRATIWLLLSLIIYLVVKTLAPAESELHYHSPVAASLPFAAGALAYHFSDKIKLGSVIPTGIATGVVMISCVTARPGGVTTPLIQISFLFATSLFTICLFHIAHKLRVLKSMDDWIGALSYPIYLNHFGAMTLVMAIMGRDDPIQFVFYVSVTSVVAAIVSNLLVDSHVNRVRNSFRRETFRLR